VASVDAYESDFGKLRCVANRFRVLRDVMCSNRQMGGRLSQRPQLTSIPLRQRRRSVGARSGGIALVARNEKASAGVRQHHVLSQSRSSSHLPWLPAASSAVCACLAAVALPPDISEHGSSRQLRSPPSIVYRLPHPMRRHACCSLIFDPFLCRLLKATGILGGCITTSEPPVTSPLIPRLLATSR